MKVDLSKFPMREFIIEYDGENWSDARTVNII